jgi:glycerol-3-phosphate dehydrogenase
MPVPKVSTEQIDGFLEDLNSSVPGFDAKRHEIVHVFSGLLPVKKAGTVELSTRPVICQHQKNGGPRGLYSVSGVKFTTARHVADKVLSLTHPNAHVDGTAIFFVGKSSIDERKRDMGVKFPGSGMALQEIIQSESVLHLEDLVFRRTDLWENVKATGSLADLLELFDWDAIRSREEEARLKSITQYPSYS